MRRQQVMPALLFFFPVIQFLNLPYAFKINMAFTSRPYNQLRDEGRPSGYDTAYSAVNPGKIPEMIDIPGKKPGYCQPAC